jgi:3-hydroxyacyl-CoA dehydrogenase / enoyl-CoA hydratase / 3-hydroxybutyryl-CoA epimerase
MASVFRLDEFDRGGARLATLTFDTPGKAANVFTREAIEELERVVAGLGRRTDLSALVLRSHKPRIFIAGADVDAIATLTERSEAEEASRRVQRLFGEWERLPFPTIAAIRGTAVGGGLEISLASTYIVASDREDIRIGLPEIKLGIVPGWGGCVRLPRRVGIAPALDIILAGKAIPTRAASKIGLVDALLPDAAFERLVLDFARGKAAALSNRAKESGGRGGAAAFFLERNPLGRAVLFSQATKKTVAATKGQYPAPLRALDVVRIGIERGRDAGFEAEVQAIADLATGTISKNLVHVFHLMEGAKKEGLPGAEPRAVRSTAVLGAGVMGGGIAQLLADQDLPVRLRDVAPNALASGMAHAAGLFQKQVARRRLRPAEMRRRMTLLHPTLELDGLAQTDLVIEAIVEKLEVKQKVFAELASKTRPDAILASNTSSLSIDAIARDTPRPERVVGMHFFNPVHRMPLVEVIAGARTSPTATNTVVELARRLGKTPVIVRDGPGFLVNRLLAFYMGEALRLVEDGVGIERIDRTMTDWGMPMGPIALVDEVGIDVAAKVAHILAEPFGDRLPTAPGSEKVLGSGRLGAKNQRGFYLYSEGRRTTPDPEIARLIGAPATSTAAGLDTQELVFRMVLPMVNEAARCLAEGVVAGPGKLDLAMIMGTGFPPFRGGLCRWADNEGPFRLVGELQRLEVNAGRRFAPSSELIETAQAGGFYRRAAAK